MFNIKSSLWHIKSLVQGGVSLLLLWVLVVVIHVFQVSKPLSAAHSVVDGRIQGGSLVIAGGGHVASEVRQRFLELAGGTEA